MRASWVGKRNVEYVKVSKLLPDYLGERAQITDPQQRNEYKAFKQKLADAQGKANGLRETNPPA